MVGLGPSTCLVALYASLKAMCALGSGSCPIAAHAPGPVIELGLAPTSAVTVPLRRP